MLVVLHHLVYFSIYNEVLTQGSIGVVMGLLFLAFNQTFFMGTFFLFLVTLSLYLLNEMGQLGLSKIDLSDS